MQSINQRTSTFENYCRERKSFLDQECLRESEIMSAEDEFERDELIEILSTDESAKEKATTVTSQTEPLTECQSWSLSSNSIITAWYENEDELKNPLPPSKSIQSYASDTMGMFSPLYEITSQHTNIFKENRQDLPKAGRTPKFGNLSYKDHPECHDSMTEVLEELELEQESDTMCTKRNSETTSNSTTSTKKTKTSKNAPRTFESFLRGEWSLDPLDSAGSGELSLEPVLEAFDSVQSVSTGSVGKSDACSIMSPPLFTHVALKHVEPEINTIMDSKRKPLGQEGSFKMTQSVDEEDNLWEQEKLLNKAGQMLASKMIVDTWNAEPEVEELPTVDSSGTFSSQSLDCYAVGNSKSCDREIETSNLVQRGNQGGDTYSGQQDELHRGKGASVTTNDRQILLKESLDRGKIAGLKSPVKSTELRLVDAIRIPPPERMFSDLLQNSYHTLKSIVLDKAILSRFQSDATYHAATTRTGLPSIDWQCCADSSCVDPEWDSGTSGTTKYEMVDTKSANSPSCKIMFWCDDKGKSRLTIRSPKSLFQKKAKSSSITLDAEELKDRLGHWTENGTKNNALLLNYKTEHEDDSLELQVKQTKPSYFPTQYREYYPDDDSELDLDLSILSGSFEEQAKTDTSSSISTFHIEDDIERPFKGPLNTPTNHESALNYNNDDLDDEELRTVMKLTKDGDELSIIFPTFSCESTGGGESDDGLSDEVSALSELQDTLRAALEAAAHKRKGHQIPFSLVSPHGPPNLGETALSSDSSMARFSDVNKNLSQEENPTAKPSTPFARRRVRFDDDVQEFLYVSEMQSKDEKQPKQHFESQYDKDDSLLGEILSSMEFILDEMTSVCTSTSAIFKRKKRRKSKKGKITRSSAYDI